MASVDELAEGHSTAMMLHLQVRAAGILYFDESDRPTDVASGTFVKIGGRYFVATAAHCVKDDPKERLGVVAIGSGAPPNAQGSKILTPKISNVGWRGGKCEDADDVGWIELQTGAGPAIEKDWGRIFTTLDRFDPRPVPPPTSVYLFGVPGEYVRREDDPMTLHMGAFPYLANVIPTPAKRQGDDIYVAFESVMKTADGFRKTPDAKGLSGSGIWVVRPEYAGVWTPDVAKLVAIEHMRPRSGEWLQCNSIRRWLTMMREDFPDLGSEIDPVLALSQPALP